MARDSARYPDQQSVTIKYTENPYNSVIKYFYFFLCFWIFISISKSYLTANVVIISSKNKPPEFNDELPYYVSILDVNLPTNLS